MENFRKSVFKDLNRVVVKVGTRIIVRDDGSLYADRVNRLVRDICTLQSQGISVVLVSSGAVGLGMAVMGIGARPKVLSQKQACAAIGQIRLMQLYAGKFNRHGQQVAQLLLSGEDFRDRVRYNNIRRTVEELLRRKIVPIVNENDTISTEEIKVGDNDKLSADVANFLDADLLILLSDTKGLYTQNPIRYPDAEFISVVPKVTSRILSMGGGTVSSAGLGGMRAKLRAVWQATEAGIPVVLTGSRKGGLPALINGESVGTLFLPNEKKLKRRQRWLAFVAPTAGKLLLDPGAVRALQTGRSSMLAVGIVGVRGNFKTGDFVDIAARGGRVIGRGRTAYSSNEVNRVKGMKSGELSRVLKRQGPEEIIHRDNLIIY